MSRLILVLGMHRSGTSLIARSLECLGAELGPDSRWSGPDNPDFAEDKEVLAIDEMTLHLAGLRWDSRTIDIPRYNMALEYEALTLLQRRLATYPVWALKEPRMCRLLPFWKPLFKEARCEVSVVHVIRHPMAVARSLARRNGLSIEHGLALWHDHVAHQFADEDMTWRSVVVSYPSMLLNPHATLGEIAHALGLPLDRNAVIQFARDNIHRNLEHEHARIGDVLPSEVDDLWRRVMVKGDLL